MIVVILELVGIYHKDAPSNCISISASEDLQLAHQGYSSGQSYGLFTDAFYNILVNSHFSATPVQIKAQIDQQLSQRKFPQVCQIQVTSSDIMNTPLFPPQKTTPDKEVKQYYFPPPQILSKTLAPETSLSPVKFPTERSHTLSSDAKSQDFLLPVQEFQDSSPQKPTYDSCQSNSSPNYPIQQGSINTAKPKINPQNWDSNRYYQQYLSHYSKLEIPPRDLTDEELQEWYSQHLLQE